MSVNKRRISVMPAKAGIQSLNLAHSRNLDTGFRRYDGREVCF
jgi:hypothetical protein